MMRASYPPPVLSNSPTAASSDQFKSTLTKCASIGAFILPIKCSATSSNCNGIPEHPLSEAPHQNHSISDSSLKTPAVFPISSIELTFNKKASLAHCKARSHLQFEKERNDRSSKRQRSRYKKSLKKRLHPKKSSKKRTTPKRNQKATQTLLAAAQASPSLLPSSKIQNVSSNDPEGLSGGGLFGSVAKGVTIALAATSGFGLPSSVSSTALGGSSSGLMPSSSYSAALPFISNPASTVGESISIQASELGDEDCLVWSDSLVGRDPDVRPSTLKFKQVDNEGRVDEGTAYLTLDEANRWANGESVRGIPALGTIKENPCGDFGSIGKSNSSESHIFEKPELPEELDNLNASTFTVKKFMVVRDQPLEVTWRLERGKSAPLNRSVRVIYGDSEDRKKALKKGDFRYYNSNDEDLYAKPENFCYVKVYKTKGGEVMGRLRDTGTPRTMTVKLTGWKDDTIADFEKNMEGRHRKPYDGGFEVPCPPDIGDLELRAKFNSELAIKSDDPSDGVESMDEKLLRRLTSLPSTFLKLIEREDDYLAIVGVKVDEEMQMVETLLSEREAESFQNYMKEKGVDTYNHGDDYVKYWPSGCLKLKVKHPDAELISQFARFVFTQPEKALKFPKVGALTCVGLNRKAVEQEGFI